MHLNFGSTASKQQSNCVPACGARMNVEGQIKFFCQGDKAFENFFLKFFTGAESRIVGYSPAAGFSIGCFAARFRFWRASERFSPTAITAATPTALAFSSTSALSGSKVESQMWAWVSISLWFDLVIGFKKQIYGFSPSPSRLPTSLFGLRFQLRPNRSSYDGQDGGQAGFRCQFNQKRNFFGT
jgi:hypothetical protein